MFAVSRVFPLASAPETTFVPGTALVGGGAAGDRHRGPGRTPPHHHPDAQRDRGHHDRGGDRHRPSTPSPRARLRANLVHGPLHHQVRPDRRPLQQRLRRQLAEETLHLAQRRGLRAAPLAAVQMRLDVALLARRELTGQVSRQVDVFVGCVHPATPSARRNSSRNARNP